MRTSEKQVKPIEIDDINIIENENQKAITAAALGNAIEWFDFGVYGYVAYVLGKVFFPDTSPSVQMIAALATFSVPFIFRPLGGLFFGHLGDKYGRQKFWPLLSLLCPSVPLVLALFHLMKQSVYGHLFFYSS